MDNHKPASPTSGHSCLQGVLLMRVSFHRALTGKILGVLDRWSFMGVDAQERWSHM